MKNNYIVRISIEKTNGESETFHRYVLAEDEQKAESVAVGFYFSQPGVASVDVKVGVIDNLSTYDINS